MKSRVLGILALVLISGGCKGEPSKAEQAVKAHPDAPDIVLVTIDTLRADRLGAYGYERDTTPFMDSLARTGVRFENAFSTSSWTVPSMVSLMTSRFASEHGVVHGLVSRGRIEHQEAIPASLPTLAEQLKKAGYATFGVSANMHLTSELGFSRGFDEYRCLGFADAPKVTEAVAEWRERLKGSKPYFLWVHYLDPHAPYKLRNPYFDGFWGKDMVYEDLMDLPSGKKYIQAGLKKEDDRTLFVNALYDSEVRFTDDHVKKLMSLIPRSDEAALVITADHGEEFADHGLFGHGRTLYNETTRIPLIVRLPGTTGGSSRSEYVSIIDVATTLARAARGNVPDTWSGLDLAGPTSALANRDLFMDLSRGNELRGMLQESYKYIYNLRKPSGSSMFDLSSDPSEKTDLASQEEARSRRMKNRIIDRVISPSKSADEPKTMEISQDHLEQLRALGYVE